MPSVKRRDVDMIMMVRFRLARISLDCFDCFDFTGLSGSDAEITFRDDELFVSVTSGSLLGLFSLLAMKPRCTMVCMAF